jgi:hypothetical protein
MDPSQPIPSPHLPSRLTARDEMTAQPVTVTGDLITLLERIMRSSAAWT